MNTDKKLLDGELNALFEAPDKLSTYSQQHTVLVKNRLVKEYTLDNNKYSQFNFENSDVHGLFIEDATLTNSTFVNGNYAGLIMAKSTLTNVSFENIAFIDAVFNGTTLINVTFKNCKIIDSVFVNSKGKVTFIDSELDSVDFHEAQAAITLINSRVHNTTNPRNQTFTNHILVGIHKLIKRRLTAGNSSTGGIF